MADEFEGTPVPVTSTLAESEEEYLDSPLEVPRAKRAQGQWAMGYREPLTPQEQNKRNQDGLDVYDRIINDYAVNGWDAIDPADLGGGLRPRVRRDSHGRRIRQPGDLLCFRELHQRRHQRRDDHDHGCWQLHRDRRSGGQ